MGGVSPDRRSARAPHYQFQIANLSEGRYRMNVQTPPGAYVASIQQGGANVYDDGFNIDMQNAQVPIRIEINLAGETVEGTVQTAEKKDAANAMVVLVPPLNRRNNPAASVPKLIEQGALKGPVDHAVPVLAIYEPEGKLEAVLFGYACAMIPYGQPAWRWGDDVEELITACVQRLVHELRPNQ